MKNKRKIKEDEEIARFEELIFEAFVETKHQSSNGMQLNLTLCQKDTRFIPSPRRSPSQGHRNKLMQKYTAKYALVSNQSGSNNDNLLVECNCCSRKFDSKTVEAHQKFC